MKYMSIIPRTTVSVSKRSMLTESAVVELRMSTNTQVTGVQIPYMEYQDPGECCRQCRHGCDRLEIGQQSSTPYTTTTLSSTSPPPCLSMLLFTLCGEDNRAHNFSASSLAVRSRTNILLWAPCLAPPPSPCRSLVVARRRLPRPSQASLRWSR